MERSSFFDSVNGDRKYKSSEFANYFASFLENGIFPNPSTNLEVMSNNNMTITIRTGKAWINGYFYHNTDNLILNVDIADGVLARIDRVVLRLDFLNREIKSYVKKGVFSSTPEAPSLQRDADSHELALADIYIAKGAISIKQSNITDLRMNSSLCGWVNSLIKVDTTAIFNQFQDWYNETRQNYDDDVNTWTAEKKQAFDTWYSSNVQAFANQWDSWYNQKTTKYTNDFDTWFSTIKGMLDGDIAGQLTNKINAITDDLKQAKTETLTITSGIGSFSSAVIKSQISDIVIKGRSLKQELDYNRDTWAEWTKDTGITVDSTGIAFSASKTARISANLKSNTKYGLLLNVVSHTSGTLFMNGGLPVASSAGSKKYVYTTSATPIANLILYTDTNGSLKVGLNVCLFELPAGSEIEADFTNLTADQLAAKYPYIKGGAVVSTVPVRLTSAKNIFGGVKAADKIISIVNAPTKAYKTVIDGRRCLVLVGGNEISSKVAYNKFEPNTQYTIQCYAKRADGSTDIGGMFSIRYTDNTTIAAIAPINTTWTKYSVTSAAGKSIKEIYTTYGNLFTTYFDYDTMQVEKGTTATDVDQKSSEIYTPADIILRSLPNGVNDEYNGITGVLKKNVGNVVLNGSENWTMSDSTTNAIRFYVSLADAKKANTDAEIVSAVAYNNDTNFNNTSISTLVTNDTEGVGISSSGNLSIKINKSRLNTLDLAGFKSYLSAKPITLTYQLKDSVTTKVAPAQSLIAYPNGTVIVEPYVHTWGYYKNGKIAIDDVNLPIKQIDFVTKFDSNGVFTPIDISKVTVAGDSKSFTITGAKDTEYYEYGYFYPTELTTNPTVVVKASTSLGGVINNHTDSIQMLNRETLEAKELAAQAFTFANDGKTGIAAVVGSPVTAGDTFGQMKTKLQSIKDTIASNLTAKGVTATATEALAALVDKVGTVLNGLVAGVIKAGVTIGGVLGTFTADATATASDILSGKKAGIKGAMETGTMPNRPAYTEATYGYVASDKFRLRFPTGAYLQELQAGHTDIQYSLAATRASVTDDANATENHMLEGADGYVKGKKVVGNIPDITVNQAALATLLNGTALHFRPPRGYYDGTNDWVYSVDPDLVASNIKQGINIFDVVGTLKSWNGEKKWATGTVMANANAMIEVTGLNFTPGYIITIPDIKTYPYSCYAKDTPNAYLSGGSSYSWGARGEYVQLGGFKIVGGYTNTNTIWIAFE